MNALQEEIYHLEELLLQPETRKSLVKLNELLADDFREFGSSGMIFSKNDILKNLALETSTQFAILEFKIEELSPDIVLSTYKASKKTDKEISFSLRSSIWKKLENKWQMVFHQGTKILV